MSSTARIVVTRPREWFARFRKLDVRIDGEVAASLRIGERVELDVTPGSHRIHVKMDWCTSPELEVVAQAGETWSFVSRSPAPWRAWSRTISHYSTFFELIPVSDAATSAPARGGP